MSLSGNLEIISAIDVTQFLNSTKKTGILRFVNKKGSCQFVFHDGDFVSANYLNNTLRIGQLLVQKGFISTEQLHQALKIQDDLKDSRLPLINLLVQNNYLDKENAYLGLEELIGKTLVEVITWSSGTFVFQSTETTPQDEYRYSKSKFSQEVTVNAQWALMDALRIYDEKINSGELDSYTISIEDDLKIPEEVLVKSESEAETTKVDLTITAEILGLDVIDQIPKVKSNLETDIEHLFGLDALASIKISPKRIFEAIRCQDDERQ